MANPLYNENQSEYGNIIQQVYDMKRNIKGNPREIVQGLLNSGQMSQDDFNRLMPMAQRIAAMMPKR